MPGTEYVALISLGLNVLIAVVGVTWGVARLKESIGKEIAEQIEKVDAKIEAVRQATGETAAALRQKITEVELWNRDTFMRRDSFYKVMDGYGTDMRSAFEKIEARLERMESKIDSRN